jgi:hypothetical protein
MEPPENELVVEQLIARVKVRQPSLRFWPSRPPGSDDRVPEERSKKSNHKNAKDKASRVATKCLVVGGQPAGIAHAKLLGRPPASQPHQILIKIS